MEAPYLIVLSRADPVARAVHDRWAGLPATGDIVDGVPIRRHPEGPWVLTRGGLHIHDDYIERQLPEAVRAAIRGVVYASIHRSESGTRCFTVHPLGNLGGSAEVGGAARTLVPASPRLMTAALRQLDEAGRAIGLRGTFEATHHGPLTELPSFFAEIGYGSDAEPPEDAVRVLSRVLTVLEPDARDRIVVGVGGGHYAPHFTDLALRRRWAFGHIVSRHALLSIDVETARLAMRSTPGAEGALYARIADLGLPPASGLVPRLRESLAARREEASA